MTMSHSSKWQWDTQNDSHTFQWEAVEYVRKQKPTLVSGNGTCKIMQNHLSEEQLNT